MTNVPLVLSTKPLGPEARQAAATLGLGYAELGLMTFRYEQILLKEEWFLENILWIFTSVNAVKAMFQNGAVAEPFAYAVVGQKTAEAIALHWHKPPVVPPAPNALELAKTLVGLHEHFPIAKAIFFCGNLRLNHLPDQLQAAHISLEEVVCYHTNILKNVAIPAADAILFFSPSNVAAYLANHGSKNILSIAIGPSTHKALMANGFSKVLVSSNPNWPQMLAMAAAHLPHKKDYATE